MAKDDKAPEAKKNTAEIEAAEAKAKADAEAKAAEEAKARAAEEARLAQEAENVKGLVKMFKNGESLYVHPTTVAAHAAAGWKTA